MKNTSTHLTLEDTRLIAQFLQTLDYEIWRTHETELLEKLNPVHYIRSFDKMDDLINDEIPF